MNHQEDRIVKLDYMSRMVEELSELNKSARVVGVSTLLSDLWQAISNASQATQASINEKQEEDRLANLTVVELIVEWDLRASDSVRFQNQYASAFDSARTMAKVTGSVGARQIEDFTDKDGNKFKFVVAYSRDLG